MQKLSASQLPRQDERMYHLWLARAILFSTLSSNSYAGYRVKNLYLQNSYVCVSTLIDLC